MIRRFVVFASVVLVLAASAAADVGVRTFTFRYAVTVGAVPAGEGPVHIWVPLAVDNRSQRVIAEKFETSIPGAVEVEDVYGNRFWHGQVDPPNGAPISVAIETTVERRAWQSPVAVRSGGLQEGARDLYRRFLDSNQRVVVDHPVLEPILAEVRARAGSSDKAAVARAIYDWVVDNVEYKKVGDGWGNGDTFWACNERYGNCTDFHALFISLARSEDIPARFEIGFPVPEGRAAGEISGYHCWVEFYLPETGWFPVDASEAFKQPERRELFYGTQPADRIHFSTGRDLELGADHRTGPLNYFVYPHVEVAGRLWQGRLETQFSFRETSNKDRDTGDLFQSRGVDSAIR